MIQLSLRCGSDDGLKYDMQVNAFPAIAWDFDGVLIDHPKAPLFHQYIKEHRDQRHFVITFRSHGWQKTIFRELRARYQSNAPDRSDFTKVINIENRAWERFNLVAMQRRLTNSIAQLTSSEVYYFEWKGMMCDKHHVPVLIDDRPDQVMLGCQKYNIVFIHPDQLDL